MKLLLNSIIMLLCVYVNWSACVRPAETSFGNINQTPRTTFGPTLSRKRRLAAFPVGSSFSLAAGIHQGVVGSPYGYATTGMLWGVSYSLPNETWILDRLHEYNFHRPRREPAKLIKRRDRRDLYHNLEIIIDRLGFRGRDCILRTLCESGYYFPKNRNNMVMEILKSIFSFPSIATRLDEEPQDIVEYDQAFRHGKDSRNCLRYADMCSFSLLDLALGKYSMVGN